MIKGSLLSENADVFAITPNRQTFFLPETENLNFGDGKNCLEIKDILKFESLAACKGKEETFG